MPYRDIGEYLSRATRKHIVAQHRRLRRPDILCFAEIEIGYSFHCKSGEANGETLSASCIAAHL